MTELDHVARRQRRAEQRELARLAAERRTRRQESSRHAGIRAWLFAGVVLAVLGIGGVLAFGDFFDRPSATRGEIDIQSSMAGFAPSEIRVTAGSVATFRWWTDDAAPHLAGGVHTMVSPDLGLYEELPAESSRTVTWKVPDKPGEYDVWCDSCCGGKDSPTMHGRIVVEPAAAVRESSIALVSPVVA